MVTGVQTCALPILIGTREFTKQYVREFGTHVALYIPSADAGGQVQPIGATQTALAASGE